MVTISQAAPGIFTINVSFSQTVTNEALNELKTKFGFINPLSQLKAQILNLISAEIDRKLDESFKLDNRQILTD